MSVEFTILPALGLVHVHYAGALRLEDTLNEFRACAAHPDCRPGLKQHVDLRAITGAEFDFPTLMRLQAQKADLFYHPELETLVAYLAQAPETLRIARLAQRSWDAVDSVTARSFSAEADALAFLGVPATALAQLARPLR